MAIATSARVSGPGCRALLLDLMQDAEDFADEGSESLLSRLGAPEEIIRASSNMYLDSERARVMEWLGELPIEAVERIVSEHAAQRLGGVVPVSTQLQREQLRAIAEIRSRFVPWVETRPQRDPAIAKVARQLGDRECIECGCTDSNACEGGCSWLATRDTKGFRDGVCSRCATSVEAAEARLRADYPDEQEEDEPGEDETDGAPDALEEEAQDLAGVGADDD